MTTPASPPATARDQLLGKHARVSTSSIGRLWRTGRSAIGLGAAMARGRRGEDLDLAEVTAIVERLGSLKGLAMKVGQLMSYVDASVPDELRRALALLQTAAPTTPFADVARTIERGLDARRAAALIGGLDPAPLAVASIGQVHRGRLPDGSDVVVKVRHPGIADALRADFRSASLGRAFGALTGASSIGGVITEAETAFLEECDLALEASRQQRFAALFAGDPDLAVPEVLRAWSSEAVLVSRYLPGRSLDELLAASPSQETRDRLGAALFRFWLRTLYRDGLFHGDPHPGNFAFAGGTAADPARVVVYDYGCVRTFEPALRRGFAALAAATRADDLPAMLAAIEAIGGRAPRKPEARAHLRGLLRGFFGPLLTPGARAIAPDEGRAAGELLRDKRAIIGLDLPGRMLFLFRLRFGLYAVLARLGARLDWSALESGWAHGC